MHAVCYQYLEYRYYIVLSWNKLYVPVRYYKFEIVMCSHCMEGTYSNYIIMLRTVMGEVVRQPTLYRLT